MIKVAQYSILLFLALILWSGCGNRGEQNSSAAVKPALAPVVSEPAYTASETDAFHANSKVESARKGKLTEFGCITIPLPEETPTMDAAAVVINPPDMTRLNMATFENDLPERSSFPFDYENDVASLKSLYSLYKLDSVLNGSITGMEKLAALALYTNRFLADGKLPEGDVQTGPSAFLITKNRLEKGISGGSDVHAALFCQLALSCGFTARLVGMHTLDESGQPLTHDIGEVYVNELRKWVAFDPYNRATYYVRGTMPLSALELHTAVVEDRIREISPIPAVGELADIASVREKVLPRYRFLYLWRMNDILGRSPRNGSISWETLYPTHLVWEDRYSLVSQGGYDKLARFEKGVKYVTHNRSDFEWTLNTANVTIARAGQERLKLYFDTISPNFNHFEVYAGGVPVKTGNVYEIKAPFDYVSVMSVNAFGLRGKASKMQIVQ